MATILMLTLIVLALSSPLANAVNSMTIPKAAQNSESPFALFLIQNGTIYVDQSAELNLVIRNPSSYYLKNVSLYILFPLEASLLANASSAETNITTDIVEEGKNVSIMIPVIEKNSTYTLNFELKFSKTGTFEIVTSAIKAVKTKGEYREEITLELNNLVVTVAKKTSVPYPPEGTKDLTLIIILFLVIIPILVLKMGNKIAWKEH
ncbi:MAG: hypothetical protein ACP6IP_01200 [Candidatus Njordarchaeia archaeon]